MAKQSEQDYMTRFKYYYSLKGFSNVQLLTFGFVFITFLGTILLMLPISIKGNNNLTWIDSLFTTASAITTTGLTVVDTGSYFTLFGQIVIITLVHVGGLGYMIFLSFLIVGFKKRLSFKSREILLESIGSPSNEEAFKFSKKIILFTLIFELAGAFLLAIYWHYIEPRENAIYLGVFHSISAFCTAGFMLFPDGFISFRNSIYFNTIVNVICIMGSVGFYVLNDIYVYAKNLRMKKYPRGFSAHSKLVITVMFLLMLSGTIYVFLDPGRTVSDNPLERIIYSSFQVVTASTTTGFNTVNIGNLSVGILWVLIILMFIGAGPGSTGGGIKSSTFGVILSSIRSVLRGRQDVLIYKRSVSPEMIMKSYSVAFISFICVVLVMSILLITEKHASVQSLLFETTSAFGTVGLSTGITSSLTGVGKIILSLTMLIGRIGPVAVGYSLIGKGIIPNFKLPGAEILVG